MRRLAVLLVLPLAGCGIALPGSQREELIHQQKITNGLLVCLIAQRYDACDEKRAAELIREATK